MQGRTLAGAVALLCAGAVGLAGCGTGQGPGSGMMPGGGGRGGASTTRCTAPRTLPGSVVHVALVDMPMSGMMSRRTGHARMRLWADTGSAKAGRVSLVASNLGWRTHELVVLPLAAGRRAGQRVVGRDGEVSESGALGEASASCAAGSGDGIRSRTTGWVTLRLRPGRYELLCNLPHHYAAGMYGELTVRG